jgi:hypothetical protein
MLKMYNNKIIIRFFKICIKIFISQIFNSTADIILKKIETG